MFPKKFKTTALTVFTLALIILSACSDDMTFTPYSSNHNFVSGGLDLTGGITVTVRKHESGRGYVFDLQNNSTDTIVNDFHVRFDSTVKIIGWNVGSNWQIDPNSTDTAKGKFGIKSGVHGQPILPGQTVQNLLWVELKFTGDTKKNPRQWWDFIWEATRDGIVVKTGYAAFPQ